MSDSEHCEHCGASIKKYWHTLTPGVVQALVKFGRAVKEKDRNSIHLLKDMSGENELTRHEWNNFTKLRFHGLAVKIEDKPGYWLLTKRGNEFLAGELEVPRRVQSFRNRVVDHDQTKVSIRQVLGYTPQFEKREDIAYDIATPEDQGKAVSWLDD